MLHEYYFIILIFYLLLVVFERRTEMVHVRLFKC